MKTHFARLIAATVLLIPATARAQTAPAPQKGDLANPAPTHGHSLMGDVFNEGPRQHAYLMKGMPHVEFPVTTRSALAQRFFAQGVGQLHGFWYFEAERSFRQVAAIDPDCAMAYWGMAMANTGNTKRAKDFIAQAVKRRGQASAREEMWIDSLAAYYRDEPVAPDAKRLTTWPPIAVAADAGDRWRREKLRTRNYTRALQAIVKAYPDDLEAKSFLVLQLWEGSFGGRVPMFDRRLVDRLAKEVLAKNPMHPLHHYRIHLWNGTKDANAVDSAALAGQSSPGIAHMWHMPGHTYSMLQRYADAAWQQEASARTDHAYMMRDGILPDQIHNYAHNNQWLIEDMGYVGRVRDALELAENMISLPRHPQYNTYSNSGSLTQGRMRLFQVLLDYELWDELIALSQTPYLEPTDLPEQQAKRLHALGVAYFSNGDAAHGREQIAALQAMAKQKGAAESLVKSIGTDVDELKAYDAMSRGDTAEALRLFKSVEYIPKDRRSRLYLALGERADAEKLAREAASDQPNQVEPLASEVDVLYRTGKRDDAVAAFKKLQAISGSVDMQAPVFQRLSAVAPDLGLSSDWRVAQSPPADTGKRPPLDSLGPLHWQPSAAPDWSLVDAKGRRVSLADYRAKGKPVLVLFYLGSGCAQCVEQLNLFGPAAKDFAAEGVSVVAIGTDSRKGLPLTSAQCKASEGFPFPLLADHSCAIFKRYRAFDDFEKMPLHGAFLIDAKGLIRWQDIGYQPFKDVPFLLGEAKRLLQLPDRRRETNRGGEGAKG